jgi:N-acetylmuramoyl-L-alanine amidase
MARKSTQFIVLHCSATRPIQDIGVKEIRAWHRSKGWTDIGYHFVIRRGGNIERGRPVEEIGAHVQGYNSVSVGVCLVGGIDEFKWNPEDNFTKAQWASLKALVTTLREKYPKAKIVGHRDFPGVAKACPCFEAKAWAVENDFA